MFCCTLLSVHSSIAIILMGKRELVALLNLSFWCLVMVEWLFLAVPRGCLRFVIVVFTDHTHLLYYNVNTHFSCQRIVSGNQENVAKSLCHTKMVTFVSNRGRFLSLKYSFSKFVFVRYA